MTDFLHKVANDVELDHRIGVRLAPRLEILELGRRESGTSEEAQLDGALNEFSADHSPMGNRDTAFVLNVASSWEKPQEDETNVRWTRTVFEAMKPFSTGGTYVNFLTEDDGADRIEAAYGKATLERLASIKRKWDPDNLFRHTKAVG